MSEIIVTTGDIERDHEVLGPVCFQASSKGLSGAAYMPLRSFLRKNTSSPCKTAAVGL